MAVKAGWNMSTFLVMSTTTIVWSLLLLLFFKDVPTAIRDVLFTVTGGVLAKWGTIVDFHFGSSAHRKIEHESDIGPTDGTVVTDSTVKTQKTTTVTSSNPAQEQQ